MSRKELSGLWDSLKTNGIVLPKNDKTWLAKACNCSGLKRTTTSPKFAQVGVGCKSYAMNPQFPPQEPSRRDSGES